MSTDVDFPTTLRSLRAKRGVGREVIAEDAGVAVNTVRNAEMGASEVTVSNLRRILNAYGYDLRITRKRNSQPANRLKASKAA